MSKEQVKQAVTTYFAAIRDGDEDAWVDNFAADGVSHDPVGAPPFTGHQGLRKFFRGMTKTFAEIALFEEDVFMIGNEAAVKWRGEGTGKNGRSVTFEGINLFEVNEAGKIQLLRAYWDAAAMMKELRGEA